MTESVTSLSESVTTSLTVCVTTSVTESVSTSVIGSVSVTEVTGIIAELWREVHHVCARIIAWCLQRCPMADCVWKQ